MIYADYQLTSNRVGSYMIADTFGAFHPVHTHLRGEFPLRLSVIVTTNLEFGSRTEVFGDPNMTAALLGRLTHKAHIIECAWESYRLKETLKEGRKRSRIQLKTEGAEE